MSPNKTCSQSHNHCCTLVQSSPLAGLHKWAVSPKWRKSCGWDGPCLRTYKTKTCRSDKSDWKLSNQQQQPMLSLSGSYDILFILCCQVIYAALPLQELSANQRSPWCCLQLWKPARKCQTRTITVASRPCWSSHDRTFWCEWEHIIQQSLCGHIMLEFMHRHVWWTNRIHPNTLHEQIPNVFILLTCFRMLSMFIIWSGLLVRTVPSL